MAFGLFCETKNKKIWFVSVFQTYIETTETNRTVLKQTETTQNFRKIPKYALYQTVSVGLLFVLVQSKHCTLCFCIVAKPSKQTVSNQTKTNRNKPENQKFS